MEEKTATPDNKLTLEIITPEGFSIKELVDEIVAPGTEGQFGVLPGHISFLTALDQGPVIYRKDKESKQISVKGAYLRVMKDHVLVLADSIEVPA